MKILVIGAGGKTGRIVVETALTAGYQVNALVHAKDPDHPLPDTVDVFEGDVQNPSKVRSAMTGCHAVIETIGSPKPFLDTTLETSAAKVILDLMAELAVPRLLVISVMGAGDSKDQAGFFYEHLLMPTFLRGTMKDKNAMEAEVAHSTVDWTLVRPPVLKDSDPTGAIRIVPDGETAHTITRADLAHFLVHQIQSSLYSRQAVTIENA